MYYRAIGCGAGRSTAQGPLISPAAVKCFHFYGTEYALTVYGPWPRNAFATGYTSRPDSRADWPAAGSDVGMTSLTWMTDSRCSVASQTAAPSGERVI